MQKMLNNDAATNVANQPPGCFIQTAISTPVTMPNPIEQPAMNRAHRFIVGLFCMDV
jgi:hypothetical protein